MIFNKKKKIVETNFTKIKNKLREEVVFSRTDKVVKNKRYKYRFTKNHLFCYVNDLIENKLYYGDLVYIEIKRLENPWRSNVKFNEEITLWDKNSKYRYCDYMQIQYSSTKNKNEKFIKIFREYYTSSITDLLKQIRKNDNNS